MNKVRSFLKETDFSGDEIKEVFLLAKQLKQERKNSPLEDLKGQSWGLIFYKKSTRTRVSFQAGVYELGGFPIMLSTSEMQLSRGESVSDTAKVLGRYLSGLVIRAFDHSVIEEFASESNLPVVNALTDLLHPCQVYCDYFTMLEKFSPEKFDFEALKGKKVVFFGDISCNMGNSMAIAGSLMGCEVVLCGPEKPSSCIDEILNQAGVKPSYTWEKDPLKAAKDADVLYTDVWVSMGKEDEEKSRLELFAPYQVNKNLINLAKKDCLFMHCLPAHAGQEVSQNVLDDKRSIIFDQAENRLHIQKAIIAKLTQLNKK